MADRRLDELGDLQRQVMDVLWEQGEATVHAVREALTEPDREPAYTTILSVLQKLEKAGWVDHRRDGRTHVYRAERSLDDVGRSTVRGLVERVFAGNRLTMLQHLIDDERISSDELETLRRMIDQRAAGESDVDARGAGERGSRR